MRKMILMLAMVLPMLFVSCSDDNNNEPKTVMVNVIDSYGVASPSLVMLYDYSEAKDFDKSAVSEMGDRQNLVDNNGSVIQPAYMSDSFLGVNTFENVLDGEYMLVVLYKPDGYSFPMFYYYGYKKIVVNEANDSKLYTIDFRDKERGVFIEF